MDVEADYTLLFGDAVHSVKCKELARGEKGGLFTYKYGVRAVNTMFYMEFWDCALKGKTDITRRHVGRKVSFHAALGLYKEAPRVLYCFKCRLTTQTRRCRMDISYTNVTRFIKPIFPFLHLKHLASLILVVYGIIHSQSLEYAQIARHTMTDTSHHHTKKRIYRFIDNVDIDLGLLMVYWCKFVVCVFCSFGCYVPVIVDITWVNGHKYLVAAIPFCFRAIPIAFRRFTDAEIRSCLSSQNEIENDTFSSLK